MPSRPGEEAAPPTLADRLRARIRAEGPITFHDYMDAALYDERDGFYSRSRVGEEGDFVTSPHVSPAFGVLLAGQVEQFWHLLERPDPFHVIEAGAGDGTLAGQILEHLSPEVRRVLRYTAVDRSPAARRALAARDVEVAADLSQVPEGLVGCVLANELLDNLPFHRVRRTEAGLMELLVGLDGDRFELRERPLTQPDLFDELPSLDPASEWEVRPGIPAFLDHVRRVLARGYVWLADYARDDAARPAVQGYRRHRVEDDVLADPGSRDITAGVDFGALARRAATLGLTVWGPVTQREALLALGFRGLDQRAQSRQLEAVQRRRGIDALRVYSNRSRANLLLAPGGLGGFRILCLGVGVETAPRSVAGVART